MTVCATFAF